MNVITAHGDDAEATTLTIVMRKWHLSIYSLAYLVGEHVW